MLSSLLRPAKNRRRVPEHSPFSSPYVDQSSPAVARLERRDARHASADFTATEEEDEVTEDEDIEEDGEDDEEIVEEDDNEDGDEDSPLLPIFSAAHLGLSNYHAILRAIFLSRQLLTKCRLNSSLQPHSRDPTHCPSSNRNYLDLGPTSIPSGFLVPC
jgi:hypothetical protein